jgi:two-component system chemotaxis sensor kinase CheA
METILRPLVESAGYRVVSCTAAEAAGAAVTIAAPETEAAGAAGRIVRLRARPEPLHPGDDSIHRYDREALLAALLAGRSLARG